MTNGVKDLKPFFTHSIVNYLLSGEEREKQQFYNVRLGKKTKRYIRNVVYVLPRFSKKNLIPKDLLEKIGWILICIRAVGIGKLRFHKLQQLADTEGVKP